MSFSHWLLSFHAERTVDINTTRALESTKQETDKILSEKLTVLQNQLEVSQNAYREDLISLESKLGEQGCPKG